MSGSNGLEKQKQNGKKTRERASGCHRRRRQSLLRSVSLPGYAGSALGTSFLCHVVSSFSQTNVKGVYICLHTILWRLNYPLNDQHVIYTYTFIYISL